MEETRELSKEENIKDIISDDTAIVVAICTVSDFLLLRDVNKWINNECSE